MGHTVIQVPVPALESIAARLEVAPVCPHVTLLGPFVDRSDVDETLVSTIRELLAPVRAFGFTLSAVGRFAGGLTYLVPEPGAPFIRLTEIFSAAFPQWPPYGGMFDEVVPHLSIGEELPETDVAILRELLPISATADEVTLTWWSEDIVEVLERYPLRTG
ncbi:2'-5' RNA ligase family protein [Cellulomonas sp. zg-ZUI22]|uniref:2'-5' RNA ligase family protein n=1 Tax=Cellulomonas sp. zg-ZUI22 TaxID=2816955 RepID=UPI001A93F27C|nr:2'-5' RNA ligase family protein [Cellulomonas sp. zg-ZUI22]MBO0898648.1 2'-5' RNA ligase family protein [Cellulomonas sp. zg-ZUI22]